MQLGRREALIDGSVETPHSREPLHALLLRSYAALPVGAQFNLIWSSSSHANNAAQCTNNNRQL